MSAAPRRRPTLDDVAEAAGVSRATVSNAYNRPDQLSAKVRAEVLRTASRLGYAGPNPVARSLATRRSGAIAFLLDANLSSAFSDPALSLTLDALAAATAADGHALLLVPGGDSAVSQVADAQVDLAVAYSLRDRAPVLRAVRRRRLPLIAIDGPAVPGGILVGPADRDGAVAAARHLVSLGHRRVAILTMPGVTDSPGGRVPTGQARRSPYRVDRERLAGYLDTLADAGIGADDVAVWESAGISRHDAAAMAAHLLAERPRPTAVLCMSDELAAGVLTAARHLDVPVPDGVSVVGFDDTPTACFADPALTTVRQNLTAKGRLTGALAAQLLAGASLDRPAPIPVELIVRASTAAAVRDDERRSSVLARRGRSRGFERRPIEHDSNVDDLAVLDGHALGAGRRLDGDGFGVVHQQRGLEEAQLDHRGLAAVASRPAFCSPVSGCSTPELYRRGP